MSVSPNPARYLPCALSALRNRLQPLCRSDFRQNLGIFAAESRRDSDPLLPAHSSGLVYAISKKSSEFSRPSWGRCQTLDERSRRSETGTRFRQSSEKINTQKSGNEITHLHRSAFQTKGVGGRVAELLRCPSRQTSNHFFKNMKTQANAKSGHNTAHPAIERAVVLRLRRGQNV